MNRSKTACFSGYRPEKFPFPLEAGCEAYINLQADITRAIGESVLAGYTRFLSGMARGFDLVCSGILLEMKKMSPVYADIELVSVLPFAGHGFKGRWGDIHDIIFVMVWKYTTSLALFIHIDSRRMEAKLFGKFGPKYTPAFFVDSVSDFHKALFVKRKSMGAYNRLTHSYQNMKKSA